MNCQETRKIAQCKKMDTLVEVVLKCVKCRNEKKEIQVQGKEKSQTIKGMASVIETKEGQCILSS